MLHRLHDGIRGSAPISWSKQGSVCYPAEVQCELCGWHARWRHVHIQHVGRRCDHGDLHGHPENHIFWPEQNGKGSGFTEEP